MTEMDRRHGSYDPLAPDTAPCEVEPSLSGRPDPFSAPQPPDLPGRELGITFRDDRPNILRDALTITGGDRQVAYGSPAENWGRTAEIASAILGKPITPAECVQVAFAMKLARLRQTPDHRDSFVDLAGYAWVWSEVAK